MNKNYLDKGGEFIKFESSYHTMIFRSKTKERALKIKQILDERNKR